MDQSVHEANVRRANGTALICPFSTRQIVQVVLNFIELACDTKLYTYQSLFARRVIESILENDGSIITGLWARQSGKTETVADMVLGLCLILPALAREFPDDARLSPFKKGFWVGVYAPIREQAEISFARVRSRVTNERGAEVMEEMTCELITDRADSLAWSNGSIFVARSASPDTQVEGKTWHLLICEESQKLLRTKVEKELRPMLAATNGTHVNIGTAWQSRGGFHVYIQKNIERYEAGTAPRNHFEFPYDIVISEKQRMFEETGEVMHLNYAKYVEQEKMASGGELSPEFRMNFMCKWQESRVIAIMPSHFKHAALDGHHPTRPIYEAGPSIQGIQVGGLDVGKINDPSVLTVMEVDRHRPIRNNFYGPEADSDKQFFYQKRIIHWMEMDGSFESHSGRVGQYEQLVSELYRLNIQILCVDASAIGDPVFERIQAMVGDTIICVPIKFSSVQKSHLYRYYLTELHNSRIEYAAGPQTRTTREYAKFCKEHEELDKEESNGIVYCQAPEGGHDDYPDSAALACWAEKLIDELTIPDIIVTSAPEGGGFNSRRGNRFMGAEVSDRSGNEVSVFGHRRRGRR